VSSLPGTGLETPDTIDLRKKTADRPLYQVLEEKEASVGGAMMGSSHTYVIPGATASSRAVDKLPAAVGAGVAKAKVDVSVTLRPEELEGLDEDAIKAKYEVGGGSPAPRVSMRGERTLGTHLHYFEGESLSNVARVRGRAESSPGVPCCSGGGGQCGQGGLLRPRGGAGIQAEAQGGRQRVREGQEAQGVQVLVGAPCSLLIGSAAATKALQEKAAAKNRESEEEQQ
jgi:hypothetical protein